MFCNGCVRVQAIHPDGTVRVTTADVGNATVLTEALIKVEYDYGAIDVAVCNAGLAIPKLMVDQELQEVERVMQV